MVLHLRAWLVTRRVGNWPAVERYKRVLCWSIPRARCLFCLSRTGFVVFPDFHLYLFCSGCDGSCISCFLEIIVCSFLLCVVLRFLPLSTERMCSFLITLFEDRDTWNYIYTHTSKYGYAYTCYKVSKTFYTLSMN